MATKNTVLVVDDQPDIREFLSAALGQLGYQVICSSDSNESMAVLATQSVDIAIIDQQLIGLQGIELGKKILASPAHQNLPMILFSGKQCQKLELEALSSGFARFLVKPVPLLRLHETLQELLNRQSEADA